MKKETIAYQKDRSIVTNAITPNEFKEIVNRRIDADNKRFPRRKEKNI